MKLTRHTARNLFFNLGQVALKEMNAEVLENVMHNFDAVRKVNEDITKLAEELAKRLYGDPQTMEEDVKKDYTDFMAIIAKLEKATETEKRVEYIEAAKAAFPELFKTYEKQIAVLTGLLNKEIEVDIQPLDKAKFAAGIIKGNENWSAFGVDAIFGAMYAEEEKKEADFSELDELLKD